MILKFILNCFSQMIRVGIWLLGLIDLSWQVKSILKTSCLLFPYWPIVFLQLCPELVKFTRPVILPFIQSDATNV